MQSFDLCLDLAHGASLDAVALFDALERTPHVKPTRDDPGRWIYHNQDTSVHFVILVHPELVASYRRARFGEDGEAHDEESEERHWAVGPNVLPDERDASDGEEEDDEDDEETEDDDETHDGGAFSRNSDLGADEPLEMAPVVLSVPLFRPAFFIVELEELLAALRERLGDLEAHLAEDPERVASSEDTVDEPGRSVSPSDLLGSYLAHHEAIGARIRDPHAIVRWSQTRSDAFFAYARAREEIARQHEGEDIVVPAIHPARAGRDVAGLCVWSTDRSTILPRCDLVLLRETRTKPGLFRRRRVTTERVVSGEALWNLLSSDGEYREHPIPHLVFRRPDPLPLRILHGLEELEPIPGGARRTELVGVIDFEIASLGTKDDVAEDDSRAGERS